MLDRRSSITFALFVIVILFGLVGCGPFAYDKQKEYKYKIVLKDSKDDLTNNIERDSLVIRYVNEDSEKVEVPYISIIKIVEFNQEEQ